MALGQKTERRYLSISHGKVFEGTGNDRRQYDFISGNIEAIFTRTAHFGGEEVVRWHIHIKDGKEFYSLCLPYNSGVFKSIILCLASCHNLTKNTPVVIEPYEGRNGYTKVVVTAGGERLDWVIKQLPEAETVQVGGKAVKDTSKQMRLISSYCDQIRARLGGNAEAKV